MRRQHTLPSLFALILVATLLVSTGCSGVLGQSPSTQGSDNGVIGWPFGTYTSGWVIENGYNWNTSNGGLDHGCSTTGQTCYELDSFDFQISGPPGSTTVQNVLSPVSGQLVDFGSAAPGDGSSGYCVSIGINGYKGYHVLVCHLQSEVQSRSVARGDLIGLVAGGQYGDHIHMTLYYLDPNIPDTTSNASQRRAMPFSDPWRISGCSYPATGKSDEWAAPTHTPVPCGPQGSVTPPTRSPSSVFAASYDHYIYALSSADGSIRWEHPTGDSIFSSPAVVNGVLYVGSWDHYVYAINADDGSTRWKYQTGAPVYSSPAVVNGVVYVGSWDNNIYALNASDGSARWRFATGSTITSSPAVVDGVVYVGSDDANVYAVNAGDGSLRWRFHTGYNVYSSPAVADGVVYVGSRDHSIYAINAADGSLRWSVQTGDAVWADPSVSNGVVYIGSDDGTFYALSSTDGSVRWRVNIARGFSPATVVNGIVYFGNGDHNVYALRASDGSLVWQYAATSAVISPPRVVNGVLYVGSDDGTLYALRSSDGSLIWQFQAQSVIHAGVAIS